MGNFFAELKRRHMFRVAAAYAVVAWLLLQIVNNIAPGLNMPNSAVTLIIVLLAVGFPVALVFAWIHELWTPSSADGASPQAKITRLDFALVGGLALVLAILGYQQLASSGTGATRQASLAPGASQPQGQTTGISIAVLPFANVSGDANRDFFSDGMTDEISGTLARIRDLRVIARASAFQFKGQSQDVRAVGQALRASHLIDGSVRQAGNRVRITAQLVRADDGVQLWSENYDRELTDIFAIQEEIAQAIAGALRVPLGLQQGDTLVRSRTRNEASYEDYLRARALVRARGFKPLIDAAALLEQVVAREPDFAPAWALLAQAYQLTPNYDPVWLSGSVAESRRVVNASVPRAEAAAQRSIQLDPRNAEGYVALGLVEAQRGKLVAAERSFSTALELDPNNPDGLHHYSISLAEVGRLKEALAMRERLRMLEPFVPVFNVTTGDLLWLNGQDNAAIMMLSDVPADFILRALFLARAYASVGRYADAADTLLPIAPGTFLPGTVEEAVRLLRTAPMPASSPQTLRHLGYLEFVYLHVGAHERVLDFYEGNVATGYSVPISVASLWHPSYESVRSSARFKTFVRNAGLLDYWKTKGWPDRCRPVGADDFVCD